jgi:hypothetical protein
MHVDERDKGGASLNKRIGGTSGERSGAAAGAQPAQAKIVWWPAGRRWSWGLTQCPCRLLAVGDTPRERGYVHMMS